MYVCVCVYIYIYIYVCFGVRDLRRERRGLVPGPAIRDNGHVRSITTAFFTATEGSKQQSATGVAKWSTSAYSRQDLRER
jgi:hypothetical protein